MALLSAYASAGDYRDRVMSTDASDDEEITSLLETVSRRLERMLGVCPGYFNTATGTRTYDGHGGRVLRLRGSDGLAHCLTAVTADSVKIDTDGDGSFDDFTLDFADAWLRGLPANAATFSEPFTAIELLPITSATITSWPTRAAAVEITGTFGWAAVPGVIKELAIYLTRDMRDLHKGGATMTIETLDGPVQMSSDTFGRFMAASRFYSRRIPAFA